ncbi:MAG: hypothetical protein M1822_000588 [Bathelium mastoideum]|nr:MAG: hypothetical protein M1822_000588 [Bathelium mastoideum]
MGRMNDDEPEAVPARELECAPDGRARMERTNEDERKGRARVVAVVGSGTGNGGWDDSSYTAPPTLGGPGRPGWIVASVSPCRAKSQRLRWGARAGLGAERY